MHYHVTHRCHNGGFLLKFAKDRDMYRSMMRERLGRKKVSVREKGVTHWLGQAQKHPSVRFSKRFFSWF
jgi:hypothetical protein